ncbi:hypothetical protein FQN57_001544 [Myotisia sp. PD_48]|nr:hypothetical protein FQN57_001544 [Myotisia sp. PD_48]
MSTWGPWFTKTYHHEPYAALQNANTLSSAAGKVIIITGGGSGIGKAMAKAFSTTSAKAIILLGRTESRLLAVKTEIEHLQHESGKATSQPPFARHPNEARPSIYTYATDIANEESVQTTFEKIKTNFSFIDVVVHCAGHLPDLHPFKAATSNTSSLPAWWEGYRTNILGTAILLGQFLGCCAPEINSSSGSPTFINISSNLAHIPPFPGASAYAPSKIASVKLLEYIQAENPHLRVFNVHPGLVTTEMSAKGDVVNEDSAELPAYFCLWLLNPQADFLKGRMVWTNWDVAEMVDRREEIVRRNLLTTGLRGWDERCD